MVTLFLDKQKRIALFIGFAVAYLCFYLVFDEASLSDAAVRRLLSFFLLSTILHEMVHAASLLALGCRVSEISILIRLEKGLASCSVNRSIGRGAMIIFLASPILILALPALLYALLSRSVFFYALTYLLCLGCGIDMLMLVNVLLLPRGSRISDAGEGVMGFAYEPPRDFLGEVRAPFFFRTCTTANVPKGTDRKKIDITIPSVVLLILAAVMLY